jgi:Fic family protein
MRDYVIISQFLHIFATQLQRKMIEKAPKFKNNSKSIKLMVDLQNKELLKKIQDDYLYWDKIKYKAKENISAVDLWNAVKMQRYLKSKSISFGKYDFNYTLTDFIERALHLFDMHTGGSLGSNTGIAETDKSKFIISSMMEEAISSSQMEGANTTRKKAKEMIQQAIKPRNKSEQMILNNYFTMKHIVNHKNEDISSEKILEIHQLISNNTLVDRNDEGKYRSSDDVYVINYSNSELVHTPPKFDELPTLINELCDFFNQDGKDFIHPIVKGCVIHFMIGWIHPFTDGNGRTARAIFYWYMLKNNYWLIEFLSISRIIKDSKSQYEKAYEYSEIDDNDLSYFITYHIKTMEKAFVALKEYITRKQNEVIQAAKFIKIPGVNNRMAQILKIMNEDSDRVLNSKIIENRFNISNFTARKDLKTLVEMGLLDVLHVNLKKQSFIKSKNFDKIIRSYLSS